MKKLSLVLIFLLSLASLSVLPIEIQAQAQQSTVNLTLYAGAVNSTAFGYGNTTNSITSPGPTLVLNEGTTYNMTLYNVATIPHAWEIVPTKAVSTSPLFGAGIDIATYVPAGGSGSVVFTPNQTGNFYYVCTFPGHIELGMWGNIIVQAAIPEYPSVLIAVFALLVATATVIYGAVKYKTYKKHLKPSTLDRLTTKLDLV